MNRMMDEFDIFILYLINPLQLIIFSLIQLKFSKQLSTH